MNGLRVGDVARLLTPLTPDETLARAAELLRSAPFGLLPVVSDGRLVGMLTQRSLADAAQSLFTGVASAEELRLMPLSSVPLAEPAALPAEALLGDALPALQWSGSALAVVDRGGRYVGMVSQADLLGVACRAQRPASIGGMATPLGVYLTTGSLSAGARGSLGLMLTGAAMAAGFTLALVLTGLLIQVAETVTGIPIIATLSSVPTSTVHLNRYDIWQHVIPLTYLVLFGLLLRLSPLAGYHAAEHQVVHAVERDRPLAPETVREMPRAHPRCGTRFAAIGVLVTFFVEILPFGSDVWRYVGAAVAVLLGWRVLGHHLQNWVTTKPASPRQLRSAIAAAEELLAKYRTTPARRVSFWTRLWHMGLLQVLAGGYVVGQALWFVLLRWPWAAQHVFSW